MLYSGSVTRVMRARNLCHVFQQMCQKHVDACVKNNVFWEFLQKCQICQCELSDLQRLFNKSRSLRHAGLAAIPLPYLFHLNAAQRPTPWVTFKHRWKRSSLGTALLLAQITKQQSLYCSPVQQSPPERIHLVIRAKWLRSFPFIIAINLLNPISNGGGKDVVSNYRDVS